MDLDIGTSRSSQTHPNLSVDTYRSGLGPSSVSGSGFWTGLDPNRTVVVVQIRTTGVLPGHVATTSEVPRSQSCLSRLLSLLSFTYSTLSSWKNTMSSHHLQSLNGIIMSLNHVQHIPNTAYTEYTIHLVQHILSTAYTQYSLY
jgi:hypothetical protein